MAGFEKGERVTSKINAGGFIWDVTVKLEQTTNGVRLTGSYPSHMSEGWEHSLVLLTYERPRYPYSTNKSTFNRGGVTYYELNETHANLTIEDIHEVRFRIRPYQRFTFRNVSLQPGHLTPAEAITNSTPQAISLSSEPSMPAPGDPDADLPREQTPRTEISSATNSSTEFEKRFAAAQAILAFPERDEALAAIAHDAAQAGDAALTKKVLAEITAFTTRDDAIRDAVRELVKKGLRTEALEIARTITAFPTRDAVLRELAE
jgi:hypothetical protein